MKGLFNYSIRSNWGYDNWKSNQFTIVGNIHVEYWLIWIHIIKLNKQKAHISTYYYKTSNSTMPTTRELTILILGYSYLSDLRSILTKFVFKICTDLDIKLNGFFGILIGNPDHYSKSSFYSFWGFEVKCKVKWS